MQMEEVSKLIDLTEQFVEYLSELYQEGIITQEQYHAMTEKKIEFIKQSKTLLTK